MDICRFLAVALLCVASFYLNDVRAETTDPVTIYRCTDDDGELTLRDTPCRKGQAQETRSMLRPKDAPIQKHIETPAPASIAPTVVERIVIRTAPRPLYECVTPDGDAYTSESSLGQPRYVPLWTLGYPTYASPPRVSSGTQVDIQTDHVRFSSSSRSDQSYVSNGYQEYGAAMTYMRDECHALPQAEVCARLDSRRDEIRRRFFNAMPSERATLSTEERGIDARLANDCGAG